MNTRLTINNLYARVAMLLLVTVISLGARAQINHDPVNLPEAIITGVHSQLLKGTDNSYVIDYTVKFKDSSGDYIYLVEGDSFEAEADYYVEIRDSKGKLVPEEIISRSKNKLTINYSTENYPLDDYTLASYTLTIIATDFNNGSKTVNFSVIRFPTNETEDGSASHPFIIKKLDKNEKGIDLKLFSECVNAGISFKDEFFKLGTDLDYEGIAYIPIGGNYNSEDKFFEGSFDGDGHTIKGVNISSSTGDVGLFGGISKGAVIQNLTLDNASITGSDNTGGIVGCNTGGIITNCHVTSSVTIQANGTNGERFGGIVGNNGFYEKDGTKGKVSNCSSAATLQGAGHYAGGIAGSNEPGCTLINNVVVGASITGLNDTGGIVGCNTGGTITNCHVTSSVTIKAKDGNGERFGGIVGNNSFYEKVGTETVYGTVSNCSSGATLQSANKYVGGIAGSNKSGCTLSNNVVVGANISANSNYGAIVGYNNSGNLDHNYYADCTGTNIGGCDGADVNEEDGAELAIALYDTKDNANATTISQNIGKTRNVILADRTLYKDGKWNTLCLPFNLAKSALDENNVEIRTLSSSEFANESGTLTLNFTPASGDGAVTSLTAGTPYIIKWNTSSGYSVNGGFDITNPVFTDVTVSSSTAATETTGSEWVDFRGTFSPKVIYESGTEKHNLYLGSGNTLYYPTATDFKLNSCRAYFVLKNGLTAGEKSGVRSFRLNFDGDPTGITTTNYTNFTNSEDTWYDLQGRRIANGKLSNGKLPKGLYIHNGRKVVIK